MNVEPGTPGLLIVDDTPDTLQLLSDVLEDEGYHIRALNDSEKVIETVRGDPPDLILLDINMPGLNGYEVCERLKKDSKLKDIPVLFLSALTDTMAQVRAFQAGGVDYVTKPFRVEELRARVRTHVAMRRQERELQESYERLRESEQLRDNLFHLIVPDLRSPLGVVAV